MKNDQFGAWGRIKAMSDEIVVINDIKLPIDRKHLSEKMVDVLKSGRFEKEEASALNGLFKPGDRVLEIGCGIGFVSCLMARRKRVDALLAIDANPSCVDYASRVARLNGVEDKCEFRCGVVDHNVENGSEVDFFVHRDFWASSMKPSKNTVKQIKVPVFDAASIVSEFKPTILVCDIEGAELQLLRDFEFETIDRVFVETHEKAVGPSGIVQLFRIMFRKGFYFAGGNSVGPVVCFKKVPA